MLGNNVSCLFRMLGLQRELIISSFFLKGASPEKEVWFWLTSLKRKEIPLPPLLLEQPLVTSGAVAGPWDGPQSSLQAEWRTSLFLVMQQGNVKPGWVRRGHISHQAGALAEAVPHCTAQHAVPVTPGLRWGKKNILHILANIYSVLIRCQLRYKHNEQV